MIFIATQQLNNQKALILPVLGVLSSALISMVLSGSILNIYVHA